MTSPDSTSRRTADDDPGFFRSLGSGLPLGQIRLGGLTFCALPLAIGAVLPAVRPEGGVGLAVPLIVVVALAVFALTLQLTAAARITGPIDASLTPRDAGRQAGIRIRSEMYLRVALSEAPILVGFVMVQVAGSVWPYWVGFVLGWPLMLLALPSTGHIERARERMASSGAHVPVWEVLLTRPG